MISLLPEKVVSVLMKAARYQHKFRDMARQDILLYEGAGRLFIYRQSLSGHSSVIGARSMVMMRRDYRAFDGDGSPCRQGFPLAGLARVCHYRAPPFRRGVKYEYSIGWLFKIAVLLTRQMPQFYFDGRHTVKAPRVVATS